MKFQTNVSNSFKYQKVNTISLELFSVGNNKSWNLNLDFITATRDIREKFRGIRRWKEKIREPRNFRKRNRALLAFWQFANSVTPWPKEEIREWRWKAFLYSTIYALSLFSIDNIAYRFEFLESRNILI